MGKCIIAGAGFAGLSAAVELAGRGYEIELLEASPKPGGRAYSFPYNGSEIDNGQHILMGCYNYTLGFLEKISATPLLDKQNYLSVTFAERGGRLSSLDAGSRLYPLNLVSGLLRYSAIGVRYRVKILGLLSKLALINPEKISTLTVSEWLRKNRQPRPAVKAFWEILTVGIMNAPVEKASAALFVRTLKEIFLSGNKAASIVLPADGLSKMYCEPAIEYITSHGGKVSLSEKLERIQIQNGKIISVTSSKKEIKNVDYLILAVPPHALNKIEGAEADSISEVFSWSPIITLHLWLSENPFTEKFYGLINSPVHWVFNHGNYISLVSSSADKLADMDSDDIYEVFKNELNEYFPLFYEKLVTGKKVIKEKRATFIPDIETLKKRNGITPPAINCAFAGDWTNTGLPATIEGAVKSGITSAYNAQKYLPL